MWRITSTTCAKSLASTTSASARISKASVACRTVWNTCPDNITLLRGVYYFRLELRPATRTAADQPHQPRLHRVQRLFPRNTRSFFWSAGKSPSQTDTPRQRGPSGGGILATIGPHSGPIQGQSCHAGRIARPENAPDLTADNAGVWAGS